MTSEFKCTSVGIMCKYKQQKKLETEQTKQLTSADIHQAERSDPSQSRLALLLELFYPANTRQQRLSQCLSKGHFLL